MLCIILLIDYVFHGFITIGDTNYSKFVTE